MPTIDELMPAAAAADDDSVPVSQGGVVRRVSRLQLLAGVQPALALAPGGLLGRGSAGVGGPEVISVGANLRLSGGVLSGVAPFAVGALPQAGVVTAGDVVAVSQGGRDVALPVGALLSGLSTVPGLDLSNQVAQVPGGVARTLADWAGDTVPVEAFGAVGDGVTDDTAAIDLAAASGRAVRFGAKTYVLNGQWTVTGAATLVGVPGRTVLRRVRQAGGAWISVQGASFTAVGIVFDGASAGAEAWGVLVTPVCVRTVFEACVFTGAVGGTLGCGLVIQARDGVSGPSSRHVVRGCEAWGNGAHGMWVQAAAGAVVEGCVAHDNGAYGICLDFNDPAFSQRVRHGAVRGCEAWGNRRGVSVGNYNETNLEPPRWGNGNPDAVGVLVEGNRCHDNSEYGIAVSGLAMQVVGNLVERNGSGLLVNASLSVVAGNTVLGPGQYGIDAGGSVECEIAGNLVQGFAVGINPGGSRGVRVVGNVLSGNIWGVTVYAMETDGHGTAFGIPCSGLSIEGNRIQLKDGSGGGVLLEDGPVGVVVAENRFFEGVGSSASQGLWAHTDQVVVRGNTWNNLARLTCNPVNSGGPPQVQVPDFVDEALVTSAAQGVASMVGQHQAAMAGTVAFIRVTNGGSGYTRATVAITGGGSGANAVAYVRDGAVVAVAMSGHGSGYGTGGAMVTIQGDGQAAQAAATVGLPVPDGRRLRLQCNGPVRFARVGSSPFQDNWTGTDILVPQASVVEWVGTWGGWQAVSFPLGDYLAPAGDGGFGVRSVANDVVMRPGGSGRLRVSSDGGTGGLCVPVGAGGARQVWSWRRPGATTGTWMAGSGRRSGSSGPGAMLRGGSRSRNAAGRWVTRGRGRPFSFIMCRLAGPGSRLRPGPVVLAAHLRGGVLGCLRSSNCLWPVRSATRT